MNADGLFLAKKSFISISACALLYIFSSPRISISMFGLKFLASSVELPFLRASEILDKESVSVKRVSRLIGSMVQIRISDDFDIFLIMFVFTALFNF